MEREPTTNVWVEGQIHSDGVSISLLSESRGEGARIEAVENLTFEELESREGGLFNMGLSDETQSAIEETNRLSDIGRIFESQPHIEEGDVLTDDNPPSWSSDNTVVVEEVTDKRADEYVIDEHKFSPNTTVADANPSYPDEDTVILASYYDGGETYGFPESRLVEE